MPVGPSPISKSHLTTSSGLNVLERGLHKLFFLTYDNLGDQFSQIFNIEGSDKQTETDQVMSGFGLFGTRAEGSPLNYDTGQSAWNKVYTHDEFQSGFAVTEVAMEDELYGYIKRLPVSLARAAAYTREVRAMDLFNSLGTTVYTADGTGYVLLRTGASAANTHFRVDGGLFGNSPAAPIDLSIEGLEAALSQWRTGMVDQRGLKLDVQPEILLVGPTDEFIAHRVLMSQLQPGGNDNDVNAVKARRNLRVMVSDFLTDDGRWFLLAPKARTGMMYYNRVAVSFRKFDDNNTGNLNHSCRYRVSSGATHPVGIWGTT